MPAQGEYSYVSVVTSNIMCCLAGDTAMTAAVRSQSVSTVSSLVQYSSNSDVVNLSSDTLYTPLHEAAAVGDPGMIKWLLKRGAHAHLATDTGELPLHLAARHGHMQACKQLVDAYPAVLHTLSTYSKQAPMHEAAAQGWPEAVEYLFTAGANVIQCDVTNKTPLQLAIWAETTAQDAKYNKQFPARQRATIQALLRSEHGIGDKPKLGHALADAADANSLNAFQFFVDLGADVTWRANKETPTALHHAAFVGSQEMTQTLLGRGAKAACKLLATIIAVWHVPGS